MFSYGSHFTSCLCCFALSGLCCPLVLNFMYGFSGKGSPCITIKRTRILCRQKCTNETQCIDRLPAQKKILNQSLNQAPS